MKGQMEHCNRASDTPSPSTQDDTAPAYMSTATADSPAFPALCVWPPNYNYWCVLDVFAQGGGKFLRTNVLPVRDNCAAVTGFEMSVNAALRANGGLAPSLTAGGFACTDNDPRSQLGEVFLLLLYPCFPLTTRTFAYVVCSCNRTMYRKR
jgi:hypothetical protein